MAASFGFAAGLSDFTAVDANKDGKLSADEHAAGSKAMFEKMDADKDGALTKAEFDAGHAAMLKK